MAFIERLTHTYDDGRILTHLLENKNERKIQFLVLNPASQFENIVKEARSV